MKIVKESVRRDSSSCNFCQKGELNKAGDGLLYPYENVVTFNRGGGGLTASICEDCLDTLYKDAKFIFKNELTKGSNY